MIEVVDDDSSSSCSDDDDDDDSVIENSPSEVVYGQRSDADHQPAPPGASDRLFVQPDEPQLHAAVDLSDVPDLEEVGEDDLAREQLNATVERLSAQTAISERNTVDQDLEGID